VAPGLAALQNGHVTFGCFNVLAKVSDEVLAVWAQILHGVPGSRLMLTAGVGASAERRIWATLASAGVAEERVSLVARTTTRGEYLRLYQKDDLCLDPFP
jgi:predicted O-linked N-acetylglucosamine transferase (SPINDLY family)